MALNHVELTKLIAAARAGDIEAFTQIVRRHQNMAPGTAYGMPGDFHLTQDAVQEAFLAAYSGLSGIQDDSAFPGWLRTTVRHYCHRLLRKRQIVEVALEEHVPLPAPERPDEDMVRSELRRIMHNAVAGLPPADASWKFGPLSLLVSCACQPK
jgi:RNA polymerase sigma-70 factor (ECF subfamily)